MPELFTELYHAPCGDLILGGFNGRLCFCDWRGGRLPALARRLGAAVSAAPCAVTREAARQLDEYFAGERTAFTLPLLLEGTAFQKAVWQALTAIPYGETISYGCLARRIGTAKAARAVGAACGANRLSLFLPCHRVLGQSGTLTGYAGGSAAKRFLLNWEQTNVCARREQKPSLLGLCRAAANFRASECNRACSYCRAQPKMSRKGAFI